MGSVRYGMRLGAVSPPPPGAGPRYRSQYCWPTAATVVASPVSRIPLLTTTAPINSFDIISCTNRVRMTEDATSELPQPATVRDHVLYSTKCLLKSQLKRCGFVRPQVYARLCEYGDNNCEDENIFTNLDRLPRFRFGGNRATTNKVREYEKRANDQRLKELTDRLKRGPIPPPRTRHTSKTSPIPPAIPPQEESTLRVTPLRSASFSQVDYNTDDKKYVRRRHPFTNDNLQEPTYNRAVATLPRSKNPTRTSCELPKQEPTETNPESLDKFYDLLVDNHTNNEKPKSDDNDRLPKHPISRSNTISTSNVQEKKRDKSRRRKGIYISQWPNGYQTSENVIPRFVEDGDFASCSEKNPNLLKNSLVKLQINDEKSDLTMWTSPQEEPLSPEDISTTLEWAYNQTSQSDEKDNSPKNILFRSDSLSEGEPELNDKKPDQISLDLSDCESRASIGNDVLNPSVPRRYSKRPLRGPYGQMLEAEMKKPETGRKNLLNNDLKFLEDLSLQRRESKTKPVSSRSSCDEIHTTLLASPKQLPITKRKISADNLPAINDNENRLVISHQRTTSSPSKLEGLASTHISNALLEQLLRGSSEQLASSDVNLQQKNVSNLL